jgi:hypothetical protein
MVHYLMRRLLPANLEIKSKLQSNLISYTLHEAITVGVDIIFAKLTYLHSALLAQLHRKLNMLF